MVSKCKFIQQPIKQTLCMSLRRDAHWKCLVLTLLVYGCLAAICWCRLDVVTTVIMHYDRHISRKDINQSNPCADGYVYIPVAFVILLYLVYLVECWHCHTRLELKYKVDIASVRHKMRQIREAFPILWWRAHCYHYVRRTRHVTRYRNGDAFTSTQAYYERVNSHSIGCAFNFTNCGVKDMSKDVTGLEDYPATKIRFSMRFSFANRESEQEFQEQRSRFFSENERRDDYMETREGMGLLNVNFKEHVIAFRDPDNLPWYVSNLIFWIASFILLSWPLRVIIEYKTAYLDFHIHKVFGTNYENQSQPGQITRVDTTASAELEMKIRNNFTIVPSYSEALLIDVNATSSHTVRDANANVTSPTLAPTRSITWNSISTSPSNGYISSFFSGAYAPNIYTNNVSITNGAAVFQNDGAFYFRASASGSSLNLPRTSSWKNQVKYTQKASSGNTMFVLSSPESPDEYSVIVDHRLSSARICKVESSYNTIRSLCSNKNPHDFDNIMNNQATSSCSTLRPVNLPCSIMQPCEHNGNRSSGILRTESPPGYDEALNMQEPHRVGTVPTLGSISEHDKLIRSSRNGSSYQTIMETSL
ncbi:hypothetical protein ACJMK2_036736 [Sinanodonta woodiana]|uniref:Transmembrane protein 151B n=1 Tax=Sinanodonta woodiana TaxID=1069815 RepID=A0ABD3WJZ1_SINWO